MSRTLRGVAWAGALAGVSFWLVGVAVPVGAADDGKPVAATAAAAARPSAWTTAVPPKPLSPSVKKALDWLVEHQLSSGGWGQGEESVQMRGGAQGESLRDTANVADTCIAALSLIRAGNSPREGHYKGAVAKAVRYVQSQVEQSDSQSLSVSSVQGTRVQAKLGPNIDTFLASMLLAEVKDRMPDESANKGVDAALAKVIAKIERHQKADGSFEGHGWAPVLAQAMCGKGINRAQQAGARVPQRILAQAADGAAQSFAAMSAPAGPAGAKAEIRAGYARIPVAAMGGVGGGAAGVELYSRAASVGVLSDSVNTRKAEVKELRDKADRGKDEAERSEAKAKLAVIAEGEKVQDEARKAVVERLGDEKFLAGFGSNGGEEFLSYMTIGESLVVKGGKEWTTWDEKMTRNLEHVQNDDGSWSGHHCITGRTFCTSTALLVLMSDRTPVPAD